MWVLLTVRGGKMEELALKIGERIRELRTKKGFTQEKLAEETTLSYTYIGKVERGEKNITLESLVKIMKAIDITLGEFFTLIDPKVDTENSTLKDLIDLLKERNIEEQEGILKIVKSITKMVDKR